MNSPQDIVLMHGWGCDHTIWKGVEAHLRAMDDKEKPRFRVTALDFPGFGSSDEPPVAWGMDDYAAWFEEFLTSRGIENPVLIGHSFGGRVAVIHGARHNQSGTKDEVRKIVLVDAAGVKPRRSLRYYIKVWSFKAAKRVLPAGIIERWRKKAGSADYAAASPVMRATLSKVVNEDLRRYMPRIKAPTLLVWGANDTATPVADARKMERLIPDAGLVVFEGAGHYSFLERAGQFNAILDSFLC